MATYIEGGVCGTAGLFWNTVDAPDTLSLFADDTSQVIHITRNTDKALNWATGCCIVAPTTRYHGIVAPILEYSDIWHESWDCACLFTTLHIDVNGQFCVCCGIGVEFSRCSGLNGMRIELDDNSFSTFKPSGNLTAGHGVRLVTMTGQCACACICAGAGQASGAFTLALGNATAAIGTGGASGGVGGGYTLCAGDGAAGATNTAGVGGTGAAGGALIMTSGIGGAGGSTSCAAAAGGAGGNGGKICLIGSNAGPGGADSTACGSGGTGGNSGSITIQVGAAGAGGCSTCNDTSNGGNAGDVILTTRRGGAAGGGGGCAGTNGSIELRSVSCVILEATWNCAIQLGFFGVTPVGQQTHVADVTVGCQGACYNQCALNTDLNALESAVNTILAQLASLGLQACA